MICKGLIDFRDLDELSTLILNVLISVIFFLSMNVIFKKMLTGVK